MYSLSPKQRPELSRYLKQMPLQQAAEHPAEVFHDNRKEMAPRCLEWVKGVEWVPFSKRRSLSHEHKESVC